MSELGIVSSLGEGAIFHAGGKIRISNRSPFGRCLSAGQVGDGRAGH